MHVLNWNKEVSLEGISLIFAITVVDLVFYAVLSIIYSNNDGLSLKSENNSHMLKLNVGK